MFFLYSFYIDICLRKRGVALEFNLRFHNTHFSLTDFFQYGPHSLVDLSNKWINAKFLLIKYLTKANGHSIQFIQLIHTFSIVFMWTQLLDTIVHYCGKMFIFIYLLMLYRPKFILQLNTTYASKMSFEWDDTINKNIKLVHIIVPYFKCSVNSIIWQQNELYVSQNQFYNNLY